MTQYKATYILILIFILTLFSCSRIKKESHEVIDKTKNTIKDKAEDIGDKVVARFDDTKPDTRFNKQRFKDFFGFYPTPDVTNIYAHSDELGIDASYYLAFECADTTVERIKKSLALSTDATNTGFSGGLNASPTFWWDTTAIQKIKPFSKRDRNLYWYLWHDKKKKKVYFLSFDM